MPPNASPTHGLRRDRPWRRFCRNKLNVISLAFVLAVVLATVVGPALIPFRYDQTDIELGLSPPTWTTGHLLGTDILGRDLLARVLYGGRLSLLVALVATTISLVIGVCWGAIAGYVGGRLDEAMMRIVDVLYSLPYMFLVIVLMALFADPDVVEPVIRLLGMDPLGPAAEWLRGPGVRMVFLFIALGGVCWLTVARIVRGQILMLKNEPFVEAARALGASTPSIIVRHLLPNVRGPLIVYATLTLPSVMLQEAFVSFLGLGIQAPQASWGTLIHDGVQAMGVAPWLLLFPGLMLVLTLFCLNLIGDGLRDALAVRE